MTIPLHMMIVDECVHVKRQRANYQEVVEEEEEEKWPKCQTA